MSNLRDAMDQAQEQHSSELKYMDVEQALREKDAAETRMRWLGNIGIAGLFVSGSGLGLLLATVFPPYALTGGVVVWTIGCGMMVYSICGH
jgi:hypothetical protein